MPNLWILALCYSMLLVVGRVFRNSNPVEPLPSLIIDDLGVSRRFSDGTEETVRWDELEQVVIQTTSEGPWCEDFFYLLIGSEGRGCCVPLGGFLNSELEQRLSNLPGYDQEAVLRATGSTSEASFVCWQRPEPPSHC